MKRCHCGAPRRKGGNSCLSCHSAHVIKSRKKKAKEDAARIEELRLQLRAADAKIAELLRALAGHDPEKRAARYEVEVEFGDGSRRLLLSEVCSMEEAKRHVAELTMTGHNAHVVSTAG